MVFSGPTHFLHSKLVNLRDDSPNIFNLPLIRDLAILHDTVSLGGRLTFLCYCLVRKLDYYFVQEGVVMEEQGDKRFAVGVKSTILF
jgi:hypothetical protein